MVRTLKTIYLLVKILRQILEWLEANLTVETNGDPDEITIKKTRK